MDIRSHPGIPSAPIANDNESSPKDGRTYGGSMYTSLDGLNIVCVRHPN